MSDQAVITRPEAAASAETESGSSVTSLVQLAIEKNVPVELLERLVALKERVEERDNRKAFFEALSRFQEICPEIRKTKTAEIAIRAGGKFSYNYAPLEEITRTIRPFLKECGLSYSWTVTAESKTLIITCTLRHIDGHQECSSFPVPVETDAKMSDAQKNGAALTYGKRQSLVSVLGLTTADQDVDGTDVKGEVEKITDKQTADLSDLCDEVGLERAKFLKWLGVAAFSEIRASDFKKAVTLLEGKRGTE